MPILDVEITLKCSKCGNTLEADSKTDGYGAITVTVQPCDTCLEKSRDEGRDQGYASGREDAEA